MYLMKLIRAFSLVLPFTSKASSELKLLLERVREEIEARSNAIVMRLLGSSVGYVRGCLFRILSVGPIPSHLAFILDGNRRYARKWNLGEGMGHRAGFLSLMTVMKYCCQLGVKYVTVYAFSIDNFKRKPEEVQAVMDLMLEKIKGLLKEESIINQYGVRVEFIGNLRLLSDPVRLAAEEAMRATADNSRAILLIAVAYTSTDEIVHAAHESCLDIGEGAMIKVDDVEKRMYMGVAPDPDILVRTSGETRISNFLLWQTAGSLLYSPRALWPEMGLFHLVWVVLNYQRVQPYLERRRKKLM